MKETKGKEREGKGREGKGRSQVSHPIYLNKHEANGRPESALLLSLRVCVGDISHIM